MDAVAATPWTIDLRAGIRAEPRLPAARETFLFTSAGLPQLDEIPFCTQLVHQHPLKNYILQPEPLSARQFSELLSSPHIDLSVTGYHTGAIAAAVDRNGSQNDPRAYPRNEWGRDMAIDAFALFRAGFYTESRMAVSAAWHYLGASAHRDNIVSFHWCDDPIGRYIRQDKIPHVKFSISPETGGLVQCSHDWGMAQLDAFSAGLFVPYRIANQQALLIATKGARFSENELLDLTALDPLPQSGDHILKASFKMLHRIQAWNTLDYGPWEDIREWRRATSVGITVAACQEAIQLHQTRGWDYLKSEYHGAQNPRAFRDELFSLHDACLETLRSRIPERGFAAESDLRPNDSAMMLLLYPFTPHLSDGQQMSILRTVYKNMGDAGFRRWDLGPISENNKALLPDAFVGMNYFRNADPSAYGEFANNAAKDYKPAEWSLFDPLLAGYYYRRFVTSGGTDTESFQYANRHMKRTLSFITPEAQELWIEGKQRTFPIAKGILPEAKAWDSVENRWQDNHNDLLMARAALALAFERGLQATKLWESLRGKE